jgi:hypothetical protein
MLVVQLARQPTAETTWGEHICASAQEPVKLHMHTFLIQRKTTAESADTVRISLQNYHGWW